MQDNFSSYIAQLKTKHKDTIFNPLFFNGCLSDTGELIINPTNLFLLMTPTEQFVKALKLNLTNPNIDSITVFSNFNDDEPVTHDKLKYIKCSKYYGLQLSDVTCYFKDNEINIFAYNTVVLDFNSIIYSHYLTKTQFGILSTKQFDGDIPDDPRLLKNASSYNNVNTDFNGFVVLGKLQDCDLFLDMYGSINLLISYLSDYDVINLSKILLSYLFEKRVYEDTYISDKFPVIYAPVQLYFMEDLNVVIPQEDVLEIFSKEIVDCVTIEQPVTPELLPIEDQELITNIKNKILSEMLLSYKVKYEKQAETVKLQCTELYNSTNKKNTRELSEKRKKKLLELELFFEKEEKSRMEALEIQYEREKDELSRKLKDAESLAESELEKKMSLGLKKIDFELQKKLDSETAKVDKIIEDSKNRAHLSFKHEIEVFTKNAYENLDEQIKEIREQKLQEINQELSLVSASQQYKINEEHQNEKRRLDTLLKEFDNFKRQEIESLYQTEYLEKLSTSLVEIKTYVESVKKEKLEQLHLELKNEMEAMYTTLRTTEKFKMKETEHNVKVYEQESIKKIDSYIKELTVQRMKTEELRIDNELRALRESKKKEITEEEIAKIKQECSVSKEDLLKHVQLEVEIFKRNEYDRCKLDVEENIRKFHNEKMEEHQKLLNAQEIQRKEAQEIVLNEEKEIKLRELNELMSVKLSEQSTELHSYKTEQLKEITLFLEKFKENELAKIELTKQVRDNELKEKRIELEREIENELSTRRQGKLKEIKTELTRERRRISAELEKQFQESLEAKNKEQEKEYASKLKEKFVILEQENETLIDKLLSSSKRQYEDFQEELKKEKYHLEKTVIEEHNKQLRELEEEYQDKIDFHKSLLKDSIKEERQKLLASEKDGIAKELSLYKAMRLTELEEGITKETEKIKDERVVSINREILAYKEKEMEAMNNELAQWKQTQEDLLRRKFQSLYSDLNSFE